MATPAQIVASRANSLQSTGAVTEEGKQASSQNAITFGLFTQNEYVRPGEEDEHARLSAKPSAATLNPRLRRRGKLSPP